MTAYVAVRCPLCDRRRLQPDQHISSEQLVEVLSAHLLNSHPDVTAAEAEHAIEKALDEAEPLNLDDPDGVGRWVEDI